MTGDRAGAAAGDRLRIAVLCPHFAPDVAPTGVVMTRIVHELAALGHEIHVVTALPWYRAHAVETGWETRWFRREATEWGSVTRVNPSRAATKGNRSPRRRGSSGSVRLPGSRRCARPSRCGHRDVATADHGLTG
jgi:colanic acid biosynthesis glycosyl transferase WcaI